ncbi:MAG: mechanosensitive ion channel family protein [Myxococcales bacterium]|nr:mechanosensitive ion channel family protein [Myxococcales bacterium]
MTYLSERLGERGAAWVEGGGVLVLAILIGWLIGALVHRALAAGARRSAATWDDALVPRLRRPLAVMPAVLAGWVALPALPLMPAAARVATTGLNVLTTLVVIWLAFRFVDLARATLSARSWAIDQPATLSLLAMAARITKLLVVVLAVITGLAALGVPVASLVAGLGIGGLAVALAAQKTIANLFGALSIGADRPFREGDYIRVGDAEGTVEAIGLRSTRIRSPGRTLITIPNADLADTKSESLAACDRYMMATTLGVVYGTSEATLRGLRDQIEAHLRAQPKIWPTKVRVVLVGFGASSIDLRIQAWFLAADWDEFLVLRQDALFAIMGLVEAAGTSFAFPTQTIHVAGASVARTASIGDA